MTAGIARGTVIVVSVLAALVAAACSGSGELTATPTSEPPESTGPVQATEQVQASSGDGVLFDIKLSGSVFDSDGDGSFRDEIEVLAPGSVEFQGHFPAPDGDLLIASCFAPECQTRERSALFTVRYWTAD